MTSRPSAEDAVTAIVRGVIAGFAVLVLGAAPWTGIAGLTMLAGWNGRVFPGVPWAILPMIVYLSMPGVVALGDGGILRRRPPLAGGLPGRRRAEPEPHGNPVAHENLPERRIRIIKGEDSPG